LQREPASVLQTRLPPLDQPEALATTQGDNEPDQFLIVYNTISQRQNLRRRLLVVNRTFLDTELPDHLRAHLSNAG
jgi:hypothetical protein